MLELRVDDSFVPDLAIPLSKFTAEVEKNGWPHEPEAELIGSCANSAYKDISRATFIAKEASDHGSSAKSKFIVTPSSEGVRATISCDGRVETLEGAGGLILANVCGSYIGQWDRQDVEKGEVNSVITSYNRNFTGHNDANPATHAFVPAPDIVTALVFASDLWFNLLTDTLASADSKPFKFLDPAAPPRKHRAVIGMSSRIAKEEHNRAVGGVR